MRGCRLIWLAVVAVCVAATLERWRQMREEMKRRAVVTIQCNLRGWLGEGTSKRQRQGWC